jgi:hypothetical protein
MDSYNERRFQIVLKITRIVSVIISVLFWILIVGALIGVVGVLVVDPDRLTFTLADLPRLPMQFERFTIDWDAIIGDVSFSLRLPLFIASIAALISGAVGLWVIRQIRGLLHDVNNERPFSFDNAKRLFYISYSMVAFSLLSPLTTSLLGWSIIRQLEISVRDGFRFSLNFGLLFVAALLYILAHIFSYGAHLQEEVDATV